VNPTFGQTQFVIMGATRMVGGYALKDPAVGSATAIGRELLSSAGPLKPTP